MHDLPLTLEAAHDRGLHRLHNLVEDDDLIIAYWSVEPSKFETGILHHLCGWPKRLAHRSPLSNTPLEVKK